MTTIPEFGYIKPDDLKAGSGDIVTRKDWNAGFSEEAIVAYVMYKASKVNKSLKNKIDNSIIPFKLKNMVTFLTRNHRVGGYDDAEFDSINTNALEKLKEQSLVSFIQEYFDEESVANLQKHLDFAQEHDKMVFAMKEVDGKPFKVESASYDKIMAFTVGDLLDEKKTNLDFITFFDVYDEDFQEYFGQLLPISFARKQVKGASGEVLGSELGTKISEYIKENEKVNIEAMVVGMELLVSNAIDSYISGIFREDFEFEFGQSPNTYRTMDSLRFTENEAKILLRNIDSEIFADNDGSAFVLDLNELDDDEFNELIRALVQASANNTYGPAFKRKAKNLMNNAIEGYANYIRKNWFDSVPEFRQMQSEFDESIEQIVETATEREMVTPAKMEEMGAAQTMESIYLNEMDLTQYLKDKIPEIDFSKKVKIEIPDFKPYTVKFGESVIRTAERRKQVLKDRKTINLGKEGKKIRDDARGSRAEFEEIIKNTDDDFRKQMKTMFSRLNANNVHLNMYKLYGLIKALAVDDVVSELEQFEEQRVLDATDEQTQELSEEMLSAFNVNIESYQGLVLSPSEVEDKYEPIIEFLNEIDDVLEDENQFIPKMKKYAFDENLEDISDSLSELLYDMNSKLTEMEKVYESATGSYEGLSGKELEAAKKTRREMLAQDNDLPEVYALFENVMETIIMKELRSPKYVEPPSNEEVFRMIDGMVESDTNKLGITKEVANSLKGFDYQNLTPAVVSSIKALLPDINVKETKKIIGEKMSKGKYYDEIIKAIAEAFVGTALSDVTKFGKLTLDVSADLPFTAELGAQLDLAGRIMVETEYNVEGNVRPQLTKRSINYGKGSTQYGITPLGDRRINPNLETMIGRSLLNTLEDIRKAVNTVGNAIK
jgi:hypothetical protein